ncbi:unnamed protein product [Diamesa serratosioi]
MNSRIIFAFFILIVLYSNQCECKGGGGRGGGSRGGGSRGSSSGGAFSGWFGGGSSKTSASRKTNSNSGGAFSGWFGGGSKSASSTKYYGNQGYWNNRGGNTYVNNHYGGGYSGGSSFLTYYMLFSMTSHHGSYGGYNNHRRWDDEEDRRWRRTTQAPYFENKQPGSESVLPAAAVLGAATAFGVYSLLPLNVPNGKPILSCNATGLQQTKVKLDDITYACAELTITISCFKVDPATNETIDYCPGKIFQCGTEISEYPGMSCSNGTLVSTKSIFCNSTTMMDGVTSSDMTAKVLNCYEGILPNKMAATIPTEPPPPKELSMGAKVHTFLLWAIGESEIVDSIPTASPNEYVPQFLSENDTIALLPSTTEDPAKMTNVEDLDQLFSE